MRVITRRVVVLLGALALAVTGFAPALAAQPAEPVTLNLAFTQPVRTLDPGQLSPFAYDYDARDLVENLFAGLMVHDPQSNSLERGLAERWEVSDDGLRWTFFLRDDVQWVRHNPITGESYALRPVVADDFVFAMRRVCSPANETLHFTSVFIVDGCQIVYRTEWDFLTADFIAERIGVRALDERTVEYQLAFPAAYFLTFTAMPEFRPLPREYVAASPAWAEVGSVVTNGPFVVADWAHDQSITLIRNPHWPDGWTGNIERVQVAFMPESDAVMGALSAGRLDRAPVPSGVVAPVPTQSLVHPTVVLLGFSMERGFMGERGVRQALAWSIDRAALTAQLLPGDGLPATHLVPPGMVGGPSPGEIGKGFDPDAARAAFASAGYANCGGVPERIEVMVSDAPLMEALARFIVEGWQRELGCNPSLFDIILARPTTVLANARGTFSDSPGYARPHAWIISWTADYYDANNWLADALHCRYGMLRTGAACDETDALIDAAGVEYEPEARAAMYMEIEDRLFGVVGKYPVVPLYVMAQPLAQQPWLTANMVGPARYDRWVIDVAARGR